MDFYALCTKSPSLVLSLFWISTFSMGAEMYSPFQKPSVHLKYCAVDIKINQINFVCVLPFSLQYFPPLATAVFAHRPV